MAKSPQKVVVKIGHMEIMLPDDSGAAQVIKTLSRGVVVWHLGGPSVQIRSEDLELSLSYLPEKTKFTDDRDRPVETVEPKAKKARPLALKPPTFLALMEGRAE